MTRAVAGVVLAVILQLGSADAFAGASLNWGSEVNPARCPDDSGYAYLEINVTRQVDNDAAPGSVDDPMTPAATRLWAVREYNQHIQVWKIGVAPPGGERYCALVRYQGSWTTTAGISPGGTDPLIASGIDGTFEGGYRAILVATESESPAYRTRGNIGRFDYGWTGTGAAPSNLDWLAFYFSDVASFEVQWSGWVYHGGRNGSRVESNSAGNAGDIVD